MKLKKMEMSRTYNNTNLNNTFYSDYTSMYGGANDTEMLTLKQRFVQR